MLDNKVAVVTGGFGCLGRAVARALQSAGARVAVLDKTAAPPDTGSIADLEIGAVDLTDTADAGRAMRTVVETFGRLDILVNVAGGFVWQRVDDGSPAVWDQMYSMNLKTAVVTSMAAIPHLRAAGRGRIISIGAASASSPAAGMGAYAASKAGIQCLTAALSRELAAYSISVNAVLPSIIDTPQNRAAMPDADFACWVSPQEIAKLIAFLASDGADQITGAAIEVIRGT